MGKQKKRFTGKNDAGKGWRIWDNMQKKWWGEYYNSPPENLLKELNGDKNPDTLTELIKQFPRKKKSQK